MSCPDALLLTHNGRRFEVKVDTAGLPDGLHYAEVMAYDMAARWRGPLFRVPITVARPVEVRMVAFLTGITGAQRLTLVVCGIEIH